MDPMIVRRIFDAPIRGLIKFVSTGLSRYIALVRALRIAGVIDGKHGLCSCGLL